MGPQLKFYQHYLSMAFADKIINISGYDKLKGKMLNILWHTNIEQKYALSECDHSLKHHNNDEILQNWD